MGVTKEYRFGCGSYDYNPNMQMFGDGFTMGTGDGPECHHGSYNYGIGISDYSPAYR